MRYCYIIRDSEAGNIIDRFLTLGEAESALASYEDEDRRNGEYSEDFYEIVENSSVRYGDSKTALRLTDKAAAVYADSDPVDILEWTDGTYSTRGAVLGDRDGLTAQDVIELLEELA